MVLQHTYGLGENRQPTQNSLPMILFNYALWETLKYRVYVNNQHSLHKLKDNI